MKTKEPFMKVMLWNETFKHLLCKLNLDIGRLHGSF